MKRSCIALMILALAPVTAVPQNDTAANSIIEWNQALQASFPATAGLSQLRYYAMLHIAIFDAVNSIEHGYRPYRANVKNSDGASRRAAAARAAHDVLVALIPERADVFNAILASQLEGIAPGRAEQGIAIGQQIAQQIIAWRQDDGWAATPPAYVLPPLPGLWQPTPPASLAATFTHIPNVKPFGLLTVTQYLPRRPPTLTSEEYTEDFNEVKELGSATSTTRTEEETLTAQLFGTPGYVFTPFVLWTDIAGRVALARGLSLLDSARLFAFVAVAMHDGLQTSHSSKFVYGFWRPVTAIQRAGEDLNPDTAPDETWLPLLTTPPYPSHSGNMSCVGASAARMMANVLGTDDVSFSYTWKGVAPNVDVTREYDSFWELADEEARSRVLGGIHFTFETLASQEACPRVSDFVFRTYMRPL